MTWNALLSRRKPVITGAFVSSLTTALYVLFFLTCYDLIGSGVGAFASIPVIVVALWGGFVAGGIAAVLAMPLNMILFSLAGKGGWDSVISASALPGHAAILLIAMIAAYVHMLRARNRDLIVKLARTNTELTRSNAELEQFAYSASHDLQEPLRMVSSYMKLLEKRNADTLDSDSKEFIGFAVDGAARMQQLIHDLLMYSRVGTKGKPFEPTDCNIVFEKAVKNLQVSIAEHEAHVTHDDLPCVPADEGQLIQLFQNLIGNALKFCKDGPPRVHVSARSNDRDWVFTVQDNGIGIAPEHRERVFQIFQRLHTREEYAGTGIGLSVSKKIVEKHGGEIWVESEAGKGTTFFFTIPVKNENE